MQTKPRTLGELRVYKDVMPIESLPDKITVDWLLDNVDLTFQGYTPSVVAIEFFNFVRLTLGEEPENENSLAHYFLVDVIFMQDTVRDYLVVRGIAYDKIKGRTAVLCCREFAKSTIIGSFVPLYMAWKGELPGFGKVNYGLYVGDSMRNNVKTTMNTIEQVYLESEWLQTQFESARFTDELVELVRLPRTAGEIALYESTIAAGKKPTQVPGRSKRKFAMRGVGAQALPLDAVLYTETGKTTMGDVQVGDMIYGADGKLAKVTKKSEIFYRPMYRITLEDGRSIDVSDDHINSIVQKTIPSRKTGYKTLYTNMDVTTTELLDMKMFHTRVRNGIEHKERLLFIENCKSLQYEDKALRVDPYTLGVFLGDGTIKKNRSSVRITCHNDDLVSYQKNIPYELGEVQTNTRNTNIKTFTILGIGALVAELGLQVNSYDKFIPEDYFYGSENQRLSLLQGLIDSDGTVNKDRGKARFVSTSKRLANDTANLVRSLGGRASVVKTSRSKSISYINDREVRSKRDTYLVYIWLNMPIARLERKLRLQKYDTTVYGKWVAIVDIEPIDMVHSQCIAIDNEEHQYVTGEYVRTHNTGTRGTRSGLQRPQFAIIDDVVPSEAEANSDTILEGIESTIESDVLNALHGAGSFAILIGTPYNKKDPVYSRVESKTWVPVVFPICESIHEDMLPNEFRGVWENRHSYSKVMKRYLDAVNSNKTRSFMQELMLRITSEKDKVIPNDYIEKFNRDDILKNGAAYNWYITTDFTTTGGSGNDFSGMAVWAVSSNNDYFLVDLVLKKMDLALQYNELFRLVNRYKRYNGLVEVGIEIDGQQKIHLFAIKELMNKKNEYFTIGKQKGGVREGILSKQSKGGKEGRFSVMVPLFQAGKIRFARELNDTAGMRELRNEIDYVTYDEHGRVQFGSVHDDGLDLISQLAMMNIFAPSEVISTGSNHEDPMWYEEQQHVSNTSSYIV